MKKRLFTIAITLIMLIGVSACGGTRTANEQTQEYQPAFAQDEMEAQTKPEAIELISTSESPRIFPFENPRPFTHVSEIQITLPRCCSSFAEALSQTELPAPIHAGYYWLLPPVFTEFGATCGEHVIIQICCRYGVINGSGEIVIPPIFEHLTFSSFHGRFGATDEPSSFVVAQLGLLLGVVDLTGHVIVPFSYAEIWVDDENKTAQVRTPLNQNYQGLISLSTGEVIIPIGKYHGVSRVHDNLVAVSRREPYSLSLTGIKNIVTGELLIPIEFEQISLPFVGGRASALRDGKWGYINIYGEEVVPFIHERGSMRILREGVKLVTRDDLWGLIDFEGNYILPIIFTRIWEQPDSDWAIVTEGGYSAGLVDITTGEFILPLEFYTLNILGENRAKASIESNEHRWEHHNPIRSFYLIDIAENRIITTITYNFDTGNIGNFHGNYAVISVGNAWGDDWRLGLIDRNGQEVRPPIYRTMHNFTDTLMHIDDCPQGRFRMQGRLYYTNTWEEILPWHDQIGQLRYNLATINKGGNWVQQYEWMDIIINGYWGFINELGEVVIPAVLPFQRVIIVSENMAAVQQNDKWGLIHIYATAE